MRRSRVILDLPVATAIHMRLTGTARHLTQVNPAGVADIVVDLHDPTWPVIHRMDGAVADRPGPAVQLTEPRAFFAPRAATWEQRFPDDDPAYAAAVSELDLRAGPDHLGARL